jgi:cyclophilin family peptidyl-prolyl cis-trans isomerase
MQQHNVNSQKPLRVFAPQICTSSSNSMNSMIDSEVPSNFFEANSGGGSSLSSVSAIPNYSRLYGGRRNTIEKVVTEENVTKESLLWFQSLKKHWLNSPRTRIQPILPIPPTLCDAPPDQIATSTSNSQKEDSIGNCILVEKSFRKEEELEPENTGMNASNGNTSINANINNDEPFNIVAATTAPISTIYRERLVQFYNQYNPGKLNTIDATLQKYYNREEELFQILHDRYCRYLPVPTNINHHRPIVFLEFEYSSNSECSNSENHDHQGQQRGTVQIQLFHDVTPCTAENFRCLCTGEKGCASNSNTKLCYINTFIHRVVPKMCMQGGDITTGDGTGGRSIYAPSLRSDPKTDLWGNFNDETFMTHSEPGLLSMANNGIDRNNSQFFITVRALPHLNGKHVVFGRVISGMNIVYDITNHTVTDPNTQRPLPDCSVKIVDCGEIKQNADDFTGTTSWIRASNEQMFDTDIKNIHIKCHGITNEDVGSTGPSHATRSDQIAGNDAFAIFNASHHIGTLSTMCDISNVKIDDCCDSNEASNGMPSINTDPIVCTPNLDAKSLPVQSSERNDAIHNPYTKDTVLSIVTSSKMNTKTNTDSTTAQSNTTRNDYTATTTINYEIKVINDNADEPMPKILPDARDVTLSTIFPNDSRTINCHTLPACRTLFENLMEHETLSIISDAGSDADIMVQRESTATNSPIQSSLYQPGDNNSDKVVATSTPSTPLFPNSSKNDESTTTVIDTSFCCDTSNCSHLTTASSTSEQVEWLHRLIDDAQVKLRRTRKKLEDRIKVLNCRPTSTGLLCDNVAIGSAASHNDHHDPMLSQPFNTLTVPSEVSLNLKTTCSELPSAYVALTRSMNGDADAEEVPINYKYISSLLQDKRSHNDHDVKVNMSLPSIPPEVGIPLLLSNSK